MTNSSMWGMYLPPKCEICNSYGDIRKCDIMRKGSYFCSKCIILWYDSGETDREKLREMRKIQDQEL